MYVLRDLEFWGFVAGAVFLAASIYALLQF